MKTQVNHHHQLNAVGILITVSILLLAFGIYKTIQFQEKEMSRSYTYTSEVTNFPTEVAKNHSLSLTNELYDNETPMEIESWMLDYSTWLTQPVATTANTTTYDSYVEEELEIEDWMLSTSEWLTTAYYNADVAEFEEETLSIEEWMLSPNEWVETANLETSIYTEETLEMEEWMLSTESWEVPLLTESQWNEINTTTEEELEIEDWMVQCCTWITTEAMNEADLYDFSENIKEEALAIEPWMTDVDSWFIKNNNTNSSKRQG